MRERTVNAIRKLQRLTERACATCPSENHVRPKYRCCDDAFCGMVESALKAVGRPVPEYTGNSEVRFMGPNGCVVAPEDRPGCSGYVCPSTIAKDRNLRREWTRLHEKYLIDDPDVGRMMAASNAAYPALIE